MKIKTLMDFLAKDAQEGGPSGPPGELDADFIAQKNENIVYIENARLETASEQHAGKALLGTGTAWADQLLGGILVAQGRLRTEDVNRVVDYQREKGMYFGEAALELGLVKQVDLLNALSIQFGYSYADDQSASKDMVLASDPFGEVAEEFRSIRAHLLNDWLSPVSKTLAVVSPGRKEGRSYFSANIAIAFSQLGKSTLLVDANLRSPRQHEIFRLTSRVGLSALLAGRVSMNDLDMLPDNLSAFPYLSVLGCGAIPPNPSELLSGERLGVILHELEQYFDVIIIDGPSGAYPSDVLSIAAVAGSALLVARRGYSLLEESRSLLAALRKARATTVGAVLNKY